MLNKIKSLWTSFLTGCSILEGRYELRGFITDADVARAFRCSIKRAKFFTFFLSRSGDWNYYYLATDGKMFQYQNNAPKEIQSGLTRCFLRSEDFAAKLHLFQPDV